MCGGAHVGTSERPRCQQSAILQKQYTVQRLDAVQGIWTVLASTMTNDLDRTKTELAIEKIDYNVGLKADAFTRRELEAAVK